MKLWHSPMSPFVRKCMVFAHEVGIAEKIELLDAAAHPINRDERIVETNPLGKVPTMVLEDGSPIFDSRVICSYLDTQHDVDSLYPANEQRFDALVCEALGDGLMDAAVASRYEGFVRPEEKQWDKWIEGQFKKIGSGLDYLETWKGARLEEVNIGSISVIVALGYLDFRHSEYDWRANHPYLSGVYANWTKRPSMVATNPDN
ncbi:MAG: glutathione S-transferase [Rhizobiaceae bacterium]|nr:glutathione S-transferase [Rhizobiaceae bacterium]